jgi:UDP-N-acetylmuramoyl-tripeptide--D-alanyl-D-alanine ligase
MTQSVTPTALKIGARLKRFAVDRLLEPVLPLRRLESYLVFWARIVYGLRRPLIIGITGSVGKSTTTALVGHVLSAPRAQHVVGRVANTFGNMNDDLGVSATLLRYPYVLELPWSYHRRLAMLVTIPLRALRVALTPYPRIMVLECGAGWTGPLERLATIAPPTISVVTRIGAAHLEKLKSLEGVVHEKGALVRAVPSSGLVVLGQGHDFVPQLEAMSRAPVIKVAGQGLELSQNIARAIARFLHVPDDAVEAAIGDFKQPEGRLNRSDLPGMTIIDDTYNANPLSMQLGLDTLANAVERERRRVAILGDMSELGDDAVRYHQEIGAYAHRCADVIIGVGELSRHYQPDHWFATSESCSGRLAALVQEDDCILVKGSASAKMPRIVARLHEMSSSK